MATARSAANAVALASLSRAIARPSLASTASLPATAHRFLSNSSARRVALQGDGKGDRGTCSPAHDLISDF